jgi:cell shape-determining protein MreC
MQPRLPSFSKSAPRDTSITRVLLVLFLCASFVFGVDYITRGAFRSSLREAGGIASLGVASVAQTLPSTHGFATRATLIAENKELHDTLARRAEEDARFETLRAENEILRELALLAESESGGVSALVLSSFSSSPYGTFVIGAGERHGVRAGATVLTPGGFVLGTVIASQDRTATVEALFAPGKEIEAAIGDVPLLLHGRGGGNARSEAPRDALLQKGDVVTVPSFGSRPVGLIVELESASSSAATTLFIRTPANLDTIRFVYVIQ